MGARLKQVTNGDLGTVSKAPSMNDNDWESAKHVSL